MRMDQIRFITNLPDVMSYPFDFKDNYGFLTIINQEVISKKQIKNREERKGFRR